MMGNRWAIITFFFFSPVRRIDDRDQMCGWRRRACGASSPVGDELGLLQEGPEVCFGRDVLVFDVVFKLSLSLLQVSKDTHKKRLVKEQLDEETNPFQVLVLLWGLSSWSELWAHSHYLYWGY